MCEICWESAVRVLDDAENIIQVQPYSVTAAWVVMIPTGIEPEIGYRRGQRKRVSENANVTQN